MLLVVDAHHSLCLGNFQHTTSRYFPDLHFKQGKPDMTIPKTILRRRLVFWATSLTPGNVSSDLLIGSPNGFFNRDRMYRSRVPRCYSTDGVQERSVREVIVGGWQFEACHECPTVKDT
jgi:hypothetical protein